MKQKMQMACQFCSSNRTCRHFFSTPAQNAMLSHDQFTDQEIAAHAKMNESQENAVKATQGLNLGRTRLARIETTFLC